VCVCVCVCVCVPRKTTTAKRETKMVDRDAHRKEVSERYGVGKRKGMVRYEAGAPEQELPLRRVAGAGAAA